MKEFIRSLPPTAIFLFALIGVVAFGVAKLIAIMPTN